MTKSEAKAIMTGSMILYMLDELLPKSEQTKTTVIRVKQMIRGKLLDKKYIPLVKLTNQAWDNTIAAFKGKNYKLLIYDFVEMVVMNEEQPMNDFFGAQFSEVAFRYSVKNAVPDLEKQLYKQSREISKEITNQIRKVLHDNKGAWYGI